MKLFTVWGKSFRYYPGVYEAPNLRIRRKLYWENPDGFCEKEFWEFNNSVVKIMIKFPPLWPAEEMFIFVDANKF